MSTQKPKYYSPIGKDCFVIKKLGCKIYFK